jgi:hypothetical protein
MTASRTMSANTRTERPANMRIALVAGSLVNLMADDAHARRNSWPTTSYPLSAQIPPSSNILG